jgi:hypothetical protein
MRVKAVLKALGIAAAYAVTVAAVVLGLLASTPDETPWLALLVAIAIVHLGFGLIVARWSAAVLPLIVSAGLVAADVGGFSVTTLLVGVPCAMLVLAGTSLRIGWDGGERARRSAPSERAAAPSWHDEGVEPGAWDDAEHAA